MFIKGCIFGLDGVLVDTAKYHMEAWERLAASMGLDLPADSREELRYLSRMDCLERILEWGGTTYMAEAEKLFWTDVKNNWYTERIAHMRPGEVLPGAVFFLREVRAAGLRTALASASASARSVLRSVQIEQYFDVIVDGEQAKKGNVNAEGFLMAAETLGLEPDECLVFEDSPSGVAAAVRAGFGVVGIGKHPQLTETAMLAVPGFEHLTLAQVLAQVAVPEV